MLILTYIILAIIGVIFILYKIYHHYHLPKKIIGPYGTAKYIIAHGFKGVVISLTPSETQAKLYPHIHETKTISYDELFENWQLHAKTERYLRAQNLK